MVCRRTFDQAVVGSILGRSVIKAPRSTQPSIPPGFYWLGLRRGVLAYVGRQVILCDTILRWHPVVLRWLVWRTYVALTFLNAVPQYRTCSCKTPVCLHSCYSFVWQRTSSMWQNAADDDLHSRPTDSRRLDRLEPCRTVTGKTRVAILNDVEPEASGVMRS